MTLKNVTFLLFGELLSDDDLETDSNYLSS